MGAERPWLRTGTSCSAGPDAAPVKEAVAWLEARVGGAAQDPARQGRPWLEACRALLEGRAPAPALTPGGEMAKRVIRALSRRAEQSRAAAGLRATDPLADGLPWGIFRLWSGDPGGARQGLLANVCEHDDSPLAWLALGDACWASGWQEDAWRAYREGFGRDPAGGGWRPACGEVAALPQRFARDPLFSGPWWAVGAYLEGAFPSFERAAPEALTRRWQRFLSAEEAPVLFFSGLFLSEHGLLLPVADLAMVRRTLAKLHPEAYEMHRERLDGDAARTDERRTRAYGFNFSR